MNLHSAIYTGTIRHRRFRPVENAFQYRLFLVYLDLSELETVFALHPRWSRERFNLAVFRRSDHPVGDPRKSLDAAVRDLVERRTGERPDGPIRLLTHLRYFGHCFNPVSFFYCFDRADRDVTAIIAEITNTPWKEMHPYVFGPADNRHPLPEWRRYRFDKRFHVSPFMDMNLHYDWRFRVPGERLNVHMRVSAPNGQMDGQLDGQLFDASLGLVRRPLTTGALSRVLWRYPLMTLKVVALIHWQALRLWWKGAPFYTHPAKRGIPQPESP
ncbi:MAG: DUF1365 domain-containing protein [Desulfococcaceae bacterium]